MPSLVQETVGSKYNIDYLSWLTKDSHTSGTRPEHILRELENCLSRPLISVLHSLSSEFLKVLENYFTTISSFDISFNLSYLIRNIFPNTPVKVTVEAIDFLQRLLVEREMTIEDFLEALRVTRTTLSEKNVRSEETFIEITHQEDLETGMERLFVIFRIKSRSFDELQLIWDALIDAFNEKLPLKAREKVEVEVEPGE